MARPLDGFAQGPLVVRAGAAASSRDYLAPLRDELAQPAIVLVIDVVYLFNTERADLASRLFELARWAFSNWWRHIFVPSEFLL